MKIVVLNYTGYRSNWGSQATSRGLIQWISNVLFKGMPSSIEIVPYPPTHWQDILHQKFEGGFLKALYANPSPKYDDLIKLERLCVKRFGRQLERVKNADVVFFQGEGAIGGSRAYKRTQLFGLPFIAKHLYKKRVISCNQTITFSDDNEELMLKNIYSSFDLNFVREEESLRICQRPGWPKFEFMPDAAFFYKGGAGSKFSRQPASYFCVTGSADLNSYNLPAYARSIDLISRTYNLEPIFIYSRKSDGMVAKEYENLIQSHASVISHETNADVDDLIPVLSGSVFVLGGRYHTSITALTLAVPAILTNSNSHKSIGLAKIFHNDAKLVDHADQNQIVQSVADILADPMRLKSRIIDKLDGLQLPLKTATDRVRLYLELDGTTSKSSPEESAFPSYSLSNRFRNLGSLKVLIRGINLGIYDRSSIDRK